MRRIFFLVLFLLGAGAVQLGAQTDELNHQKYWYYRWRLRNNFMKIGPNQGESLIASTRSGYIQDVWGGGWSSGLHYGDQTLNLGYYLSVLALEYYQLSNNQQNTDQTLMEIYYALYAINRLDMAAESPYRTNFSPALEPTQNLNDLNGFFYRDDVDDDFFIANKDHLNNDKIYSRSEVDWFVSDWAKDRVIPYNYMIMDPLNVPNAYSRLGEMSQDQALTLLMGLGMVYKFVPSYVFYIDSMNSVVPFQDGYYTISQEAKRIAKRIIGHCNQTIYGSPLIYNWQIRNKVTGYKVARGHDMLPWSYGIAESGCSLFETGAASPGFLTHTMSCDFPTVLDYNPYFHNLSSASNVNFLQWTIQRTTGLPFNLSQDNAHMFGLLLTLMGTPDTYGTYYNGCINNSLEYLLLVNKLLYAGNAPLDLDHYKYLLNTAPCEGPYNFGEGDYPHWEWSGTERLLHADRRGVNLFPGEYPGLDYMLYHNLYYTLNSQDYLSPFDMIDTKITDPLPLIIAGIGTVSNPFYLNSFNTITASNKISEYGINPALGNALVVYRAGYCIDLDPGFEVEPGADFLAYIDPFECADDNTYKSATTDLFMVKGFQPHVANQEVVDYHFDDSDPQLYPYQEALPELTTVDNMRILPNPTTGIFTVGFSGIKSGTLYITNSHGMDVLTISITADQVMLDLSGKPAGIYFVRLVTDSETSVEQIILL